MTNQNPTQNPTQNQPKQDQYSNQSKTQANPQSSTKPGSSTSTPGNPASGDVDQKYQDQKNATGKNEDLAKTEKKDNTGGMKGEADACGTSGHMKSSNV